MPDRPALPTGRIATLDGVRGMAVMGILLMNIAGFALPEGAYYNPAAYGSSGPLDYALWAVMFLLVDGKMRALFSMLFGASLLLVAERAETAGESAPGVHYRRMLTLALFGAAHLYLIWWGDILLHYALVGCLAFAFRGQTAPALLRGAILCFVIEALIAAMLYLSLRQIEVAGTTPGAAASAVKGWLDTRAELGLSTPDRLAAEIALYRGPWSGIVAALTGEKALLPLYLLYAGGAETLGLMLLGMAALRSGFLTGQWPRPAYWRAAAWGYGIGLAGTGLLLLLCLRSGCDSLTVFGASMAGGLPFRPLVAIGHAALGVLWLTAGRSGLRDRVIAAGRVAFSNYLGTSLAMTALFYGWGFGLFGRLDRTALYLVVVGAWAVMLLWSKPWLDHFRYGPLEWLWRTLARGRPQPLRRRTSPPNAA